MECENAYRKNGKGYILCRKAGEVSGNDMAETAHAMCGFQRFCPEHHCCTLLPGWSDCRRRDVNQPVKAQEVRKSPAKKQKNK